MRSLKSGLVAIVLSGVFGCAAVAGCSADGGTGITDDGTGTDQNPTNPGSSLPPPSEGSSSGGSSGMNTPTDAGKKDASKSDSGQDAGPPPPNPGDTCTTLNAKASKTCGMCGKAETLCIDDGSGKGKWSDYGQCGDEQGVCTPGATQPCGNCGTQTCTSYCAWGACAGQPANACQPGAVENTTAGCATPGTYRNRTCGEMCTWSSYSATCAEAVNANKMTMNAAVGGVATFNGTLTAAQVGKKVSGTCPVSVNGLSSAANYQYVAVELTNPTAQTATVQVYHTGTGSPIDTLIWVYKKTLAPTDDNTLAACDFGSADDCDDLNDLCGNAAHGGSTYAWAGVDNVVLPPNGKVLIYSAGYSSSVTGPFTLAVKTKSLK